MIGMMQAFFFVGNNNVLEMIPFCDSGSMPHCQACFFWKNISLESWTCKSFRMGTNGSKCPLSLVPCPLSPGPVSQLLCGQGVA